MALHYDFYVSPNSRGSNRKRYHARPAFLHTFELDDNFEGDFARRNQIGKSAYAISS